MAKYFSKFPLTYYTLTENNSLDIVTNITSRFNFANNIKNNSVLYNTYDITDGDTPEIVSSKVYGTPENHWIIMFINDILDVESDWPLKYETLNSYINEKYKTDNSSYSGIRWAKTNIHSYYKTVTTTIASLNTSETKEYEIDANTYASIADTTESMLLADGNTLTISTSKISKSYFDYETELNESKRKIKLLKPEFAVVLESQLKKVFEDRV